MSSVTYYDSFDEGYDSGDGGEAQFEFAEASPQNSRSCCTALPEWLDRRRGRQSPVWESPVTVSV